MSIAFFFTPFSKVIGQPSVNIYLVGPRKQGNVAQKVTLQGTINTKNGAYRIWFGNKLVVSSKSEDYYVNANFTIPELPRGDYSIILQDVAQNVNATEEFSITTSYGVEAIVPVAPALLQEGNDGAV